MTQTRTMGAAATTQTYHLFGDSYDGKGSDAY